MSHKLTLSELVDAYLSISIIHHFLTVEDYHKIYNDLLLIILVIVSGF